MMKHTKPQKGLDKRMYANKQRRVVYKANMALQLKHKPNENKLTV